MKRALVAIALVACRHKHEQPCTPPPAPATGEGTYYNADGTGNCSFDAGDVMVAAMNGADYDHAAWCGACLEVTSGAARVIVRVVDQCPGCKHGDLDLSEQAFAQLAPVEKGRIPITWREVACDVGTHTLSYRIKDNSNPFWIGIQVRDHRYPIAKLEARDASGGWTAIARADYNYFVAPHGLGAGPFALRVTDTRGHVVEDAAVPIAGGASASQLPACLKEP